MERHFVTSCFDQFVHLNMIHYFSKASDLSVVTQMQLKAALSLLSSDPLLPVHVFCKASCILLLLHLLITFETQVLLRKFFSRTIFHAYFRRTIHIFAVKLAL